MSGAVLTWLLNGEPDPQRAHHWAADPGIIAALRDSVTAHGRQLIVITDCLEETDTDLVQYVRVPPGGNPYWVRWVHALEWLSRTNVTWLWCVDGSDVEMLTDPFGRMAAGRLYCGSEPHLIGHPDKGDWLRRGASPEVRQWLAEHPGLPILNMGTLGGDRPTMLEALGILAARAGESDWEIGAFQQIAHETFADRVVTGPAVHTEFGADERTLAWWKHK